MPVDVTPRRTSRRSAASRLSTGGTRSKSMAPSCQAPPSLTSGNRTRRRCCTIPPCPPSTSPLRRADVRLLRHAHRLGGRHPGGDAAAAGGARHRRRPRSSSSASRATRPALEAGPYRRYREVLGRGAAAVGRDFGVDRRARGARRVRRRPSATGRRSRTPPRRSPGCRRASSSASSRTATTTCSRASDARLGVDVRLGRSRPQQVGALQAESARTSSSRSSGSACRGSGSSTSPRACSTTTCRRRRSA